MRPSILPISATGTSPILIAGVCAAAVDAFYFSAGALLKGQSPVQVLQGIAGFWLGKSASSGGAASAALGAATHLALALVMAVGFVLFRDHLPLMRRSLVTAGLLYGLLLYAVMYWIVLPLRWPQLFPAFHGWTSVGDVAVHLAVGLTIAWMLRPSACDPPLG